MSLGVTQSQPQAQPQPEPPAQSPATAQSHSQSPAPAQHQSQPPAQSQSQSPETAQHQSQPPAQSQSPETAQHQSQLQSQSPAPDQSQAQTQTSNDWNDVRDAIVERMLAGGGKPGVVDPTGAAGKTGLEVLEAMLRGELPYPHIADTLEFVLIEVAAGRAVFQGTPQLKHYNPMGTVHGGWYATLLDSALGCAVQSMLPAGCAYTTVELGMNIVRAASHRSGPLRAIGSAIHSGRQLATAEARIVDPDGRLYAHATTTCLVFEVAQRERA